MESKYLRFEDVSSKDKKTKDFRIWNKSNDSFLGWINWRPGWRRYVFTSPDGQCCYDVGCLLDIADFIKGLMDERANKLVELVKNS